jgi:hypothetical protein
MLGNQQQNSTQNPFSGNQVFYLNVFSNVLAPNEDGYQKGINDTAHFRVSLLVDAEMKKNEEVNRITGGKDYYALPVERKVTGYIKSLSTFKETVKGKPVKKMQIVLFDPNAEYVNPFEEVDADNPKNGTVVGATYVIKTSFSLKGKEMLAKLANLNPEVDEMFSIIIVPANSAESGYKEQIVINGKRVYNVLVKQGDEMLFGRFGDPAKSSKIQHDVWNEEYLDILEKYEDADRRVRMDGLMEKFITSGFSQTVHAMFLRVLRGIGYDLVESGTNQDGTTKYKYVKLGETVTSEALTSVTTYVEPNGGKTFKPEIESTMPATVADDDDASVVGGDELPF